ncbi:hypothetical protein BFW38_03330 [Terasakiispira papahanaumokuakeensis]|uniref:Uncharacterized protein n=1 Tax=Terasakiispira papahanaumokuakeensis TaxID=197479 RepID=A0A1E2V6T1_9GAMM|nr:helix-turn-helix domain-containing protein [Terasakiispira papahanaumokuakeensis]ODC02720.1 hypothetical protein BFW38_03330 [Terasakiispira papahanaumokuakeensis]
MRLHTRGSTGAFYKRRKTQEISILQALNDVPEGMTRSELAQDLKLRVSSVCGRCRTLIDHHLVSVEQVRHCRVSQRRVQALVLTAEGQAALSQYRH